MIVRTVEDLYENKEYYLYLGTDMKGKPMKPRRVRLLGVLQIGNNTEIYICNLTKTGTHAQWVTRTETVSWVGIGVSEREAIENYKKIVDLKLDRAYSSDEDLENDLKRVETGYGEFTYFNYRNIKESV